MKENKIPSQGKRRCCCYTLAYAKLVLAWIISFLHDGLLVVAYLVVFFVVGALFTGNGHVIFSWIPWYVSFAFNTTYVSLGLKVPDGGPSGQGSDGRLVILFLGTSLHVGWVSLPYLYRSKSWVHHSHPTHTIVIHQSPSLRALHRSVCHTSYYIQSRISSILVSFCCHISKPHYRYL